ncbi:MAG: MFS transporter [Clostridia bacterium]|nr:MFS transporter [Clostridia bacterium]
MNQLKYGYNQAEYKKFKTGAWLYLILFSLLYCAHYCTRLNIGNAQVYMTEFSSEDIGILSSVLFWTYGVGHLINGRLGEIFGIRRFIVWSVILSVICNIFMSFQTSILAMTIIWGLNGFFQSMAWSPGVSSLTAWWPGDKRGFATGFANAFSGFGQVFATLMVALGFVLLPNMGWRSAFIVPAILPILFLIIYWIFAKSGPKAIGLQDYKEEDQAKAEHEDEMEKIVKEKGVLYPYFHLLKKPVFWVWIFVVFASGIARYGLVTWIPKYLNETTDMGAIISLLTSTILPIGMGIGTLVVPMLTDKFCPNNRLWASVISGLVSALCVVGIAFLNPKNNIQFTLMLVCLFFAGFFIYAINGTVWAYAADVGGRVFASTASGILDFAAYMGAAIQAAVYGFILGDGNWNAVFVSIAVFCALIAIVALISSRKIKA